MCIILDEGGIARQEHTIPNGLDCLPRSQLLNVNRVGSFIDISGLAFFQPSDGCPMVLSAISRMPCSIRAALLAWARNTNFSGDYAQTQCAYSVASCDFLLTSQLHSGSFECSSEDPPNFPQPTRARPLCWKCDPLLHTSQKIAKIDEVRVLPERNVME